ncbi:MAG: S8 family serine peptidase, partial [Roseiflexaceae bacterium]|nr:S8 family serine peptidase [Roseiflexaceae bacterium]
GRSRVIGRWVLLNSNLSNTFDRYGHGTHIAGIIGGNACTRSISDPLFCRYIGIAPEVNLISVKVANDEGVSYVSDVVAGIEWVIENRQSLNIRVMNLSMVSSVAESYRTSVLAAAVERAWFNGILVVVSAGNGGPNTMRFPPANDPFVVTVGASDTMGTFSRTDDRLAPWSSYGVTQDGHIKPDVVAPGRAMVGPLSFSSAVLARSDRIVDNQYLRLSGSSMAAPVVAGVAALAFQARPEWTNDQVKWLLMHTAFRLGGASPLPGQGAGLVDAAAVVQYSGTPGFANQGLIRSNLLTTADGSNVYSSANWSTANWSTANWSTANWSTMNWSTAIVDE